MKSYLITDPKYYTNDTIKFCEVLQKSIKNNKIDMICFRDKTSKNFDSLAKIFIKISKDNHIKNIFINSNISLASKLNATGVHLTSTQFEDIKKAKSLNLKTIISCHNENDILKAIKSNVDMITYSPIFATPNKGEPKGIDNLQDIVNKYNIPIIALGGIVTQTQIAKIKNTSCYGFASIRYFVNI